MLKISGWKTVSALTLLILVFSFSALAEPLPAVAKRVPGKAAMVVVLERPGGVMAAATKVLGRFKMFNPDLDLVQQGAKIKAELGENLLTAEGMRNFGIDPSGSFAAFNLELEAEPALVLSLADPATFKQRLFAAMEKATGSKPGKARKVAGADLIPGAGGASFAFKGKWCLVVDKSQAKGKAEIVQAFFGGGKKLAQLRGFKTAWSGMLPGGQSLLFMPMAAIVRQVQKEGGEKIRSMRKRLKSMPADRRGWLQSSLKLEEKRQRSLVGMLKLLDGLAVSARLDAKRVDWGVRLLASKKGRRTLGRLFPGGAKLPGFHRGLVKGALFSSWASFSVAEFIEILRPLPTGPERTFGDELAEASKQFKGKMAMDLMQDVIRNFEGSMAFYALNPDTSKIKAEMPPDMQVLSLMRLGLVLKVRDQAKLKQLIQQMESVLAQQGKPIERKQVAGATLRILRPAPGTAIAWALKGDALILGMGENTVANLLQVSSGPVWQATSGASQRGAAQLDFANLSETLSSAVSRNLGGAQGREFRMVIWPMVQQILAQFARMEGGAEMKGSDLAVQVGLQLH